MDFKNLDIEKTRERENVTCRIELRACILKSSGEEPNYIYIFLKNVVSY